MSAVVLESLESLPRTPASDVKKLGWRGVMKTVTRSGKVLVTNHDEPEAVILSTEEYTAILDRLRIAGEKDRVMLDALRRRFDERLASLNEPGAGDKLSALFDKPFSFDGKPFTGNEY